MDDADNKFRRCIQFELVAGKKKRILHNLVYGIGLCCMKKYIAYQSGKEKKGRGDLFLILIFTSNECTIRVPT